MRKDRPGVTQPDIAVAGWNDFRQRANRGRRRLFGLFTVGEQTDAIAVLGQYANEPRDVAARRLQITIPFVGIGRPRSPDCVLGHPFGGNGDGGLGGGRGHVAADPKGRRSS